MPKLLLYGLPEPPAGWPQKPAGISLCMIVKNEERFLEQCLESVADVVDEINIVDTGSTDGTIEIARRFGARIERREWRNDFAWARNESLAMATKRWVLQLDADEVLEENSRAELRAVGSVPAHLTALLVRCTNVMDDAQKNGSVSHAVTRIFPNHPEIRFRGRVHEFPAVGSDETTIVSLPTNIRIRHFGYLDAVVSERNKHDRNMSLLEKCVAEEPQIAFHWYNLGLTAHIAGDQQRAAQALEHSWEICKTSGMRVFVGNALQTLSTIYTEYFGDPQRGLEYSLECLKIAPNYSNAHFTAGKSYLCLGDVEKAREMFLAAIADAPHNERQYIVDEEASGWKAMCELGSTYQNEGDWPHALEWYERAMRHRPGVRVVELRRAMALEALERVQDAEAAFQHLHEQFADEQSALQYVNFLLRRNPRKAIEVIDHEYRSLSAGTAVPMLIAAASVSRREKIGDGEAQLLLARELLADSVQVQTALEELYRTRGDFAKAYDAAQAVLTAQPENAVVRYNAAIDCVNLDRKEEALSHLRAIPPDVPEAGARAAFLRAVLLRELGRYVDALSALDIVLEQDPAQVDALLMRGAVFEALDRKAEAEAAFQAALPAGQRRAAIELAGFYLREGRPHDAKSIAEAALADGAAA
jgi:tetratricopeptide (TPR) repeat protein